MAEYTRHTGVAHAPLSEPTLRAITEALKETANDIKKTKSVGCAHFLGYLKTRPRDSSIPDECLTCTRILSCM